MLLKFKVIIASLIAKISNQIFILSNKSQGVTCPICQIQLKKFKYYDEHNSYCPRCGSLSRHRALALIYQQKLGRTFPKGHKKILQFAAEKYIIDMMDNDGHEYKTADFEDPSQIGSHYLEGRDILADMTNMHNIEDSRFDVVIAFDVLEHIKEDIKAIKELNRILIKDGVFCFSVPIQREHTHEYLEGENKGDPDHVRSCGFDYIERFKKYGFDIEIISLTEETPTNLLYDLKSSEHHPEIYICKKN